MSLKSTNIYSSPKKTGINISKRTAANSVQPKQRKADLLINPSNTVSDVGFDLSPSGTQGPGAAYNDNSAKQDKRREERYIPRCKYKWSPNSFFPYLINVVAPPLERLNTPRTIQKQISLDRTFDRDIWLHSKNHLQAFAGPDIEKDLAKGKIVRKIKRRQRIADKQ